MKVDAHCSRREMLKRSGQVALATALFSSRFSSGAEANSAASFGLVSGQVRGAEVGNQVLREGGNAVDAAVAAALAVGVAVPNGCGIGGYGGHMVIALPRQKKITCIDYNSPAPAAFTPDIFRPNEKGEVPGRINEYGWLAAGVPGTLAGLQLALDRYGTRQFRELVQPAIKLAEDGFPVIDGLARAIRSLSNQLLKDPGSSKLLFKNGQPLVQGELYRNPDLAKMLAQLAEDNSVASFYRGPLARTIAQAFQKNGGLLSEKDLADYRAREIEPITLRWGERSIHTAPLTAGGLTVLQALHALQSLDWSNLDPEQRDIAMLESLRLAWADRLELLGDPAFANIPVEKLLSEARAAASAEQIKSALQAGRPIERRTAEPRKQTGTVHLNSVDREGNMVALTLTHGNAFGAAVTVEGLGLMLGHGMSRFDPEPGRPNSPAPGKKPLHNMCPTIVTEADRPILSLGATGGRMIPNSIYTILLQYIGLDSTMEKAVAAPRAHTEGELEIKVERHWPEAGRKPLLDFGYKVQTGPAANAHALAFNPKTGASSFSSR